MRQILIPALLGLTVLMPVPAAADVGGKASFSPMPGARYAVMAGSSLRSTLEGWARSAGWTVVWDNASDFRIRASAVFPGDFETAVVGLVDSIHLDNPDLSVILYRGNRVLHIEEQPGLSE